MSVKFKRKKRKLMGVFAVILRMVLVVLLGSFVISTTIKLSAIPRTLTPEKSATLEDVDCILVLGCGVWADGTPSPMLLDRITTGVQLYELGVSNNLLMSGDHINDDYNEVGAMKDSAIELGVPENSIPVDPAGVSTYDSVYRAAQLMGVKKMVIVTQSYHLPRALFIARRLGIEAYAVPADAQSYSSMLRSSVREYLAQNKDFVKCLFRPAPESESGIEYPAG